MTINGEEMTVKTIQYGNAEIVIYRPANLDEKERTKRESNLCRALERFGKEMVKKGLL